MERSSWVKRGPVEGLPTREGCIVTDPGGFLKSTFQDNSTRIFEEFGLACLEGAATMESMNPCMNGRQHRYWKIVPATLKNLVAFETAAA